MRIKSKFNLILKTDEGKGWFIRNKRACKQIKVFVLLEGGYN